MNEELKKEWVSKFERLCYLQLPYLGNHAIEQLKDFISEITQAEYERGINEATPQYKKDMQDAYERGQEEFVKMVEDRMVDGYSDLSKYKNDILGELLADIKNK